MNCNEIMWLEEESFTILKEKTTQTSFEIVKDVINVEIQEKFFRKKLSIIN